jgi:hypothetical protein
VSDTAQTALAVVCYVVAMSAQLAGIALLVRETRRTRVGLRRWRDARPPGRQEDRDALVAELLGNQFDRTSALVLLAIGVVAGALGHLLDL